jgi:hypothetical protein
MNKYPLIGGSICAVVLLVLASLTNVVGYQTIQNSQQNLLNEMYDQKELLFQTILDFANNKEIQRLMLDYQMESVRNIKIKSPIIHFPALTKSKLNSLYHLGSVLSQTISVTKVSQLIRHYHSLFYEIKEKIISVIHNDVKLSNEISRLSSLSCNCGNESNSNNDVTSVICSILFTLAIPPFLLAALSLPILTLLEYFYSIGYQGPLFQVLWGLYFFIFWGPFFVIVAFLVFFGCMDFPHPLDRGVNQLLT